MTFLLLDIWTKVKCVGNSCNHAGNVTTCDEDQNVDIANSAKNHQRVLGQVNIQRLFIQKNITTKANKNNPYTFSLTNSCSLLFYMGTLITLTCPN